MLQMLLHAFLHVLADKLVVAECFARLSVGDKLAHNVLVALSDAGSNVGDTCDDGKRQALVRRLDHKLAVDSSACLRRAFARTVAIDKAPHAKFMARQVDRTQSTLVADLGRLDPVHKRRRQLARERQETARQTAVTNVLINGILYSSTTLTRERSEPHFQGSRELKTR